MKKLLFVGFLIVFTMVNAQDSEIDNAAFRSVVMKQGDEYLRNRQYIKAINIYKAILDNDENNLRAQYQIAESYKGVQDYDNAEYYYQIIAKNLDTRYPLAGFYYASMLKIKGDYDASLRAFKTFREFLVKEGLHEDEKFRSFYKQSKIEIDGCQLALNQITLVHPDYAFEVLPMPLNSEYNDYAAFTIGTDTAICLTSGRQGGKGKLIDNQFGESFADIFRYTKNGSGEWEEAPENDKFSKMINSKYGDGSGVFNKDRTKFYYTFCGEDETGDACHIYFSSLIGGKWSESLPLNSNINQKGVNSQHPNITPGGDTLFFSSNREGGYGELDLWMSFNAGNDNWGPPINLGNQINTPFNEVAPYFDSNQRHLFFASKGHRGFGGYDIYLAKGNKFEKAEIYNVGIPFNSSLDDTFFFLGTRKGYLSSNRKDGELEGLGKFDVYGYNIRSKEDIIADVSIESTIAGRNSLFVDDYNFDSNETEIVNQIISRMLSSSISEVDLILSTRQLEVYNSLSLDDKERIDKIVKARIRKMTNNMIRSIRTEDDYYYQQLSTDRRKNVDNIVSSYLGQQGIGNSVTMDNQAFDFYSDVDSEEREKIDMLVSDRLKTFNELDVPTPTFDSFTQKEQVSLDGIAAKFLTQKKSIDEIVLDMNEKVFVRDQGGNLDDQAINRAIRERLVVLSDEEKYQLVKGDQDFYETLTEDEKNSLKSIANTFMVSDLSEFNEKVDAKDLDLYKFKSGSQKQTIDKLLLKMINNMAKTSIYLTETTFSDEEIDAADAESPEEMYQKLLELRPDLDKNQKEILEVFVKTAYKSYQAVEKKIFIDTPPAVVTTEGKTVGDPTAVITSTDITEYENLTPEKKRAVDNIIALDYLAKAYQVRAKRLQDQQKYKELKGKEKVYVAALAKKVTSDELAPDEKALMNEAFTYYGNLSKGGKGFINRIVLSEAFPMKNGKYVLPKSDARQRANLSASELELVDRMKKFRENNGVILTENIRLEAMDIDQPAVDLIALNQQAAQELSEKENTTESTVDLSEGEEVIANVAELEIKEDLGNVTISLPIDKTKGFEEITVTGRLIEENSRKPLSSYAISLIEFDNKETVIEGYTNVDGYFEFTVSPQQYDAVFEKTGKGINVVLDNFDVIGRKKATEGMSVSDTRAFFNVGESALRSEVKVLLDELAKAFNRGGKKIEIESHTDNTGNAENNLKLSKNRGYAARDYLLSKGIEKANISVIWHGSERPLADNGNPFGRQLNRRVDIRLIAPYEENFGNYYLIRPGTSMNALSRSMGVSIQAIQETNGLSSSDLAAYQPVRFKAGVKNEPDYNLVVPGDIGSTRQFIYTVKPGETLPSIAEKFQVPEELIMEQNNLNSLRVEVGTHLIIYSN